MADVANPAGGGLGQAVGKRGGMEKIRCLYAGSDPDVAIEVDLSDDERNLLWTYSLAFSSDKKGDPFVVSESVIKHYKTRPPKKIAERACVSRRSVPVDRLTASIESEAVNENFKNLAGLLGKIKYFYLVPQIIKLNGQSRDSFQVDDPFGGNFIRQMFLANQGDKKHKIKKIEKSLKSIIPMLENFKITLDKKSGKPHIEIKLKEHNGHGAVMREDQLSDGTIRLIALLWICHEISGDPVIIEEAELSFNDGIVEDLSVLFEKSLRQSKRGGQIFVSTHNGWLLSNPGINADGLIIIKPSNGVSTAEKMTEQEWRVIEAGFPPYDAVFTSVEKASKINLGL